MEERRQPVYALQPIGMEDDGRAAEQAQERRAARLAPPVVTFALLFVIAAVFLAMVRAGHGDVMAEATQFGDKESYLIRAGQWWRLITPIFLHGSWTHLIVNGLSLAWFGGQMERLYGARRYLLIFMWSGAAGNVLSYLLLPNASLGASGALFGLVGAGIVFPLRFRAFIPAKVRVAILRQLVPVALLNLSISFSPGIDKWAHFGGFVGGSLLALFLIPVVLDDRPFNRWREVALSLATLLTLAVTGWAGWLQWRVAHGTLPGNQVIISLNGSDICCSFKLPPDWQSKRASSRIFIGRGDAQGATLKILDSSIDPNLASKTDNWFAANRVVPQERRIDGWNTLIASAHAPNLAADLCKFSYNGTLVALLLTSPPASYPAAHHDFEQMLASLKVGK